MLSAAAKKTEAADVELAAEKRAYRGDYFQHACEPIDIYFFRDALCSGQKSRGYSGS